jgi:hypothetical protein
MFRLHEPAMVRPYASENVNKVYFFSFSDINGLMMAALLHAAEACSCLGIGYIC